MSGHTSGVDKLFDNIRQGTNELQEIYHGYDKTPDTNEQDKQFSRKFNEVIQMFSTIMTVVQSENDVRLLQQQGLRQPQPNDAVGVVVDTKSPSERKE